MITCIGLTTHEELRFSRIRQQISELCLQYGHDVRVCHAEVDDGVSYVSATSIGGRPVFKLPAEFLLDATDDEVLVELHQQLATKRT